MTELNRSDITVWFPPLIRITSSIYGDIWIAITDEAAQGLLNLNGVTVYQSGHLIPLTAPEIRTLHRLRAIGGPGGSMEIAKS
jgi:hypothetical protein